MIFNFINKIIRSGRLGILDVFVAGPKTVLNPTITEPERIGSLPKRHFGLFERACGLASLYLWPSPIAFAHERFGPMTEPIVST